MRSRAPRSAQASLPQERIQKVIAAAGIGSRREVERWIQAGRLAVNGKPASLGDRITATDRLTLDGRNLRLKRSAAREPQHLLIHHRAPGMSFDIKEAVSRASLPGKPLQVSRRWLLIQALPVVDGGLELLTDDGPLAQKISRGLGAFTMDYVLRVRGRLTQSLIEEFLAERQIEDEPMQILAAEAQLGEGSNHWIKATVRATRTAQVRHWWAAQGFNVGRLMRVRFGPLQLVRELPRGHSRALDAGEIAAVMNEISAAAAAAQAAEVSEP